MLIVYSRDYEHVLRPLFSILDLILLASVYRHPEESVTYKQWLEGERAYVDCFNSYEVIMSLLHDIQTDKPSFRPIINPLDLQRVLCVRAKLNNARISRQQGCFLLFGIKDSKTEAAVIPNKWQRLASNSQKILVKNKAAIMEELKSFGISKRTLFPELEAQATEIMDSYKSR